MISIILLLLVLLLAGSVVGSVGDAMGWSRGPTLLLSALVGLLIVVVWL